MQDPMSSIPPITWVDVARRLTGEFAPPDAVVETEVFWSGLTITLSTDDGVEAARAWLEGVFPSRLLTDEDEGGTYLKLDAPQSLDRLPVTFETNSALAGRTRMYRPSAALEGKHAFGLTMPKRDQDALPLFAFHSVKGGVGRTTTAITLARNLTRSINKPILLVDADFEAPGLSYLFASRKPESAISFEDMLALIHSDPNEDLSRTVEFISGRLAEQRVGELFVMPVKRTTNALAAFAIRPEHIVSARIGQPFIIVDILRDIATKLGCGAVVIDLRAGLVEIAMQVLSDPSVERCFVSTTSGQSIKATCDMLRALGQVQRLTGCEGRKPVMVINQIPSYLLGDRRFLDGITRDIEKAAIDAFQTTAEKTQTDELSEEVEYGGDGPLTFVEMSHFSDLIRTSDDWEGFLAQLDSAGFAAAMTSKFEAWSALDDLRRSSRTQSGQEKVDMAIRVDDRQRACRELAKMAKSMVVADTAPEGMCKPLLTPPLRRLSEDFLKQSPIAVIEGAKGTGKTMMARFLMESRDWSIAAKELDTSLNSEIRGPIIPVFASSMGDPMSALITSRTGDWAKEVGMGNAAPLSMVRRTIQECLEQDFTESQWSDLWLDLIAWVSGVSVGTRGAWQIFLDKAKELACHPVALFEGLEEVITDPYTNAKQALALRALIVNVPLRLREQAGRPVGALVFVRGDMVEAVIRQNLAQFRASFRNYALAWSTTDILELVVWMANTSGAIPGLWNSKWRETDRSADLERIWGRKLGPEKSREARSTEWVLAVLTDLNGRLTARDLVRFIAEAATLSVNDQPPQDDRLFTPAAMRRAVAATSGEKVSEYPTEVTVLKTVFEAIKRKTDLETPLDTQTAYAAGLSEGDLSNLVKYGVFFEEDGSFEVPELFRIGLGMGRKGARPNIISLTRRALEKAQTAN